MHLPELNMDNYDYNLPDKKIALFPSDIRSYSKLLYYNKGVLSDHVFSDISGILPQKSFLIFNNTKVIPARLIFFKENGTRIEIFCLEPVDENGDFQKALKLTNTANWKCLVGNLKRWKEPITIKIPYQDETISLTANLLERSDEIVTVNFNWNPGNLDFATVLNYAGKIPLPPYIKRENVLSDNERYQTVYATNKGSVAAPTAGLHFTNDILNDLIKKNILMDFVTLHVGAGTFKPVASTNAMDHTMHYENFIVGKKLILNFIEQQDRDVFSIGTTSARSLESLYWIALKNFKNKTKNDFGLGQWEAYSLDHKNFSFIDAMHFLVEILDQTNTNEITAQTSLMMLPGYKHKVVKGLITNFHQPRSTLLLLLASFIGDNWKSIYKHALKNNYRFLSYGDSSLIIP